LALAGGVFFRAAAFVVDFLLDPVDRVAAAFVVALAIGGAILGKGAGY
jgi:hypothetical protein